MNNETPLRQEEYQAIARENQKLHQRIAELENRKGQKGGLSFMARLELWWQKYGVEILFTLFLTITPTTILLFDRAREIEQKTPVRCGYLIKDKTIDDWDKPYKSVFIRGKNTLVQDVQGFYDDPSESIEFAKKYGIKYCPGWVVRKYEE